MRKVLDSQKLPLTHPEFRYPPSRNPYEDKLKAQGAKVFSNNETEAHRGKWREILGDRQTLHVEIGSNAGHVIVEWAKRNPEHGYIGIDWKYKAIHRATEKVLKHQLGNLLFFRSYAERLPFMFAPGEIDHLYLFFPDPWPKKAHWKNRYITEGNLRDIARLMKPGGVFHIKTDHPGYFEWMLEAIEKVTDIWEPRDLSRDLHAKHPHPTTLEIPDVTLFERLFIKDGIKINSLKLHAKSTAL